MSSEQNRRIPDKASLDGLEAKWTERWETEATYRFDRAADRAAVYSIDTPPPTVSGSLHVGHVFSYSHTDTMARFHRMRGAAVFYPMGWDDNGLPTERRVQNYYGVRCDPSLPYDPDFAAPEEPGKELTPVSRRNFVELCLQLTEIDEQAFEALFQRLSLSVDWSLTYTTIGQVAQRVSQRAFLRMLARGEAYQVEAPTLWDVDFRTAVAQAEIEDRERPGAYHLIRFAHPAGDLRIDTTRPELLPACVGLVAHPDDARYRDHFGTEAVSPLFGVPLPLCPHPLADPEKGTGLAMICTFGDATDITWWRELKLPLRAIIERDGRLRPVEWGSAAFPSNDPAGAQRTYDELAGKTARQAQHRIVELLAESGDLEGEPRPITHAVKFFEKGDRPLEIVTSRQWFVRTIEYREALLERGAGIRWHPEHMRERYDSWVRGLNTDWCISRQRFFGVPFPVWYPIREDGTVDHDGPILAEEDRLPIDPSTDAPTGFAAEQRGRPGGFIGDPDVMDTWATSSLTPQIAGGWLEEGDLFERVFPMDVRPQAHEIIRTWLFSTVVRAHFEHGGLPWSEAAISGWVLDPDRKKMSKSKGNVVTPMGLLEQYGSDAVRYWATSARLGVDTAFDEGQIKVGRRLAIKLLNAARFVLSRHGAEGEATAPLDRSLLASLATLIDAATADFASYDSARALARTEQFFWRFCDDYLELVKSRTYGNEGEEAAGSAHRSLSLALSAILRLFAPFLPFVTEEVWSWWQEGSVHRAAWPAGDPVREAAAGASALTLEVASSVLGEVRRAKTEGKVSLKAEVARLVVRDTAERITALRGAVGDLERAGNVRELVLEEGEVLSVEVALAPS
jgi:valyl-tRNA synthetase